MNRILYIVSTLKRSGPTNQLFHLLNNIEHDRFKPILITLSPEPEDSRWADFRTVGVELYSLNVSRSMTFWTAKYKLQSIINDVQPALIHTHGVRPDILVSLIKKSAPHVAVIHNFPQIDYFMNYGRVRGFLMSWLHGLAMKKTNKTIGVSDSVTENLKENFKLRNVDTIYNGVDIFQPDKKIFNRCRLVKYLGIPENATIFISTGHLSNLKDPLFLIEAWDSVTNRFPECHLVFVGSGFLSESCKAISANKKNIHFIGRVSSVVEYLKGSHYFVSASKSEGFGLGTAEAMSCGLPVLLSDNITHQEFFQLNAQIGKLFKLNDIASFIEAVGLLLSSDYHKHQEAALSLVESKFNSVKMSISYETAYLSVINGS